MLWLKLISYNRTRSRLGLNSKLISITWLVLCGFSLCLQAENHLDLTELNIEELMNRKVITASKTEQNLSDTAAAVFVISQNDIRRSGVNSIPEALRLAPGLHVARIDSSKWAITARGFNGRFSNNLLVLMDGRAISVSNTSAVFWEVQDRVLEDIERIEVIRGPGASVWGANAVNGIINIITKNATDTQEGILSLVAGDRNSVSARQGMQFSDQGYARVYAKFFRQGGFVDENGDDAKDDWDMSRGGFRLDWTPSSQHNLMLQGDAYGGSIEQKINVPTLSSLSGRTPVLDTANTYGGNMLARWEYTQSLASRLSTQIYYNYFRREDRIKSERHNTFAIDFQHEIALHQKNEFTWGMTYRLNISEVLNTEIIKFSPKKHQLHLVSGFLQDKQSFFNQQLEVSLGSKFEYHSFSGFEYLPSIRMLWKMTHHQRVWAAISRSIRVPSIAERHIEARFAAVPQLQSFLVLQGDSDFDSEKVLNYELGYRFWYSDHFSFDLVAFYNNYDDLIFTELAASTEAGKIPLKIINGEKATTRGIEFTANWHPFDWARFQFSSSYLDMKFEQFKNDKLLVDSFPSRDKRDPEFQFSLRSSFDLNRSVELDLWLRYVDAIPDIEVINADQLPSIGSYVAVDVRLAWQPHNDIELAFVGRNLNDPQHLEYLNELGTFPIQIQRSFYVQAKWAF